MTSTRIVASKNSRLGTPCTNSRHQDSLGAAFQIQNLKLCKPERFAPLRNQDEEYLVRDMLFNDKWRRLEREREGVGVGMKGGERRARRSGSSLWREETCGKRISSLLSPGGELGVVGDEKKVEEPVRVRRRTFGKERDNSSGEAVYDVRERVVTFGNTAEGESKKFAAEKSGLAKDNLERVFLFWIKILPTPFWEETGTSFICRLRTTFIFRKDLRCSVSAAAVSISDNWIQLRYFNRKIRSGISG